MKNDQQELLSGIIGYSDDCRPIVTPTYCCDLFLGQEDSLCLIQECWYCKYADFRKSIDVKLNHSICHHPKNQINTNF